MARRMTIALILFGLCSGCTFFPRWMQPTNLWKLNGQPPGGSDSMYFSVPDPAPAPHGLE